MSDYYEQKCYEARDRMDRRMREADAERMARRYTRARRQRRRRRAGLAAAFELLTARQRTA